MNRPVCKITPTIGEKIVEFLGLIIIAFTVLFPLIIYSRLPDIIPTHININGEVDSYGRKGMFIILPIVSIVTYVGISVLQKFPHIFNYPVEVNENNFPKLYSLGIRLCRFTKIAIILLFGYIVLYFSLIAVGKTVALFPVIILFLGLNIGIIFYLIKMLKCK